MKGFLRECGRFAVVVVSIALLCALALLMER